MSRRRKATNGVPFGCYVALGDSFTEGVGDHAPDQPNGVRGWADRVAAVLDHDDFTYANLASAGASSCRSWPSRSIPRSR